jgi:hypothetical protein
MDLPKGVAITHGARTFRDSIPDDLATKLGVKLPEVEAPKAPEVKAPKAGKKK